MTLTSPSSAPLAKLPTIEDSVASWLRGRERSLLRRLVDEASEPGVVSLAGGLPAVDQFPAEAYVEAVSEVLADPRALQYGRRSGILREHIVELLRRRGVQASVSEVQVMTGAQQALQVAVNTFVEPGDTVALERFVYTGIRDALAPLRPRLLPLRSSLDRGLDVDAFERRLRAGERPRLLYVIPDAHNPLGVSLAPAERQRLIQLAHDFDFVIVEDDPYGLLSCEGEFEPPLAAFDADRVIYVGSFSKLLAPALRLGWMRRPAALGDTVSFLKETVDLECSGLTMSAVSRLLDGLDFDDHLERLRSTYRPRRDAMLEALTECLPDGCRFAKPGGGMFVWVVLPEGTDANDVLERTIREQKLVFVPSSVFADRADNEAPSNAARLSFSLLEPTVLRDAVARFASCL